MRKAQSAKPDSASAPPKPEQKSEDMSAPQLSLTKELLTDTRSFFGNSKIEILMVRANELAFQGRYADAVLLFQTINELSPQNLEILVRLGTACAMIGNMELAQNYLTQAFQINPKDPRVINNLALTFIPTGNFDQVNHFMEVLLETNENQNYYYGLNNLAAIHFLQQKYKEAEILFDRAMLLNPKHHVVLNNKAVLLGALGMYRESLPYFDNAIAIDPSYLKAQVNKRVVLEFIKPDLKTLETPAPFEQEGDHWFTGALQNITEPETLPKETQKEAPTTISITESHGAHLALNSSQTEDNNFDPWGSPLPAATRPPSQQVASTPRTIFSNYFNQSHPTSHPEAQDNPWGPQAAPSTHHPPLPHIMEQKVDEETESNPWGVGVPSLPQAAPSTHHLPLPQIVEHKVAEEIQLNPWGVDVSSLPASSQVPLNPWGEPSPFQSQSTSTPWSEPSSGASSSLASTSVASDRPIKASSSMTASNPWSVSLEHANSMSNISGGGGGDTKANAIQFKSPAQERAVDVASPRTIVPGEIGRLDLEEVDKHYNRSDGSTEEKVSDGNSDVKEMDYMPSPRSRATSMTSPHLNEEERKKRKTKLKDSSQDITQTPKDSTIIFKQKLTLPKNISRADIFGRKKSPREDTPKSAKSPRSDSPNLEKSKDKE
uniref:Uncharacterized protein n=1 Tax=Arcella intermedia TaxID=1963864 RepID=A0A6B2KYZ4_9EUKA